MFSPLHQHFVCAIADGRDDGYLDAVERVGQTNDRDAVIDSLLRRIIVNLRHGPSLTRILEERAI